MPGNPRYWRYRPRAPSWGTVLGLLDEIPDGGGKEYRFGRGKGAFSMFVVRRGQAAWGYFNLCPHFSLPLNYRAEQFTNEDGSLIRCSMHFAEFRFEDGFCVAGAAEDCHLDPVPLAVQDGHICIIDEADLPSWEAVQN